MYLTVQFIHDNGKRSMQFLHKTAKEKVDLKTCSLSVFTKWIKANTNLITL